MVLIKHLFVKFSWGRSLYVLAGYVLAFSHSLAALEPTQGAEFEGKRIRQINIEVGDVFEGDNLAWIYRAANQIKINTRHDVIQRELLFRAGDPYQDFRIKESERNLRSLRIFRQVVIKPHLVGDEVDVSVNVQDTWTLIPEFSFSSGAGKNSKTAAISESDLMGMGKRIELGVEQEENRDSVQALWEDPRVWGTKNKLVAGFLERTDGNRQLLFFGRPFRSLIEPEAYGLNVQHSDTLGRLFEDGEERYIYRQKSNNLGAKYTFASGNPEQTTVRFSVGYEYQEDNFSQADEDDYEDLDLDPEEVSNDPSMLADNRRYSGPLIGYQRISADFIAMNYIDRFERVEDYNLGGDFSFTAFAAPTTLGSRDNTAQFTTNYSRGARFSRHSFLRGEAGAATRAEKEGLRNSLARAEARFYNVLGNLSVGNMWLGKHTLAASTIIDYGEDLDADRELLLGADNGLRGYEARTFTGDKRLILNFEDRVHLIDDAFKLVSVGAVAFLDVGGTTKQAFGNILDDNLFANVGVGLRFAFPRSTGGQVLRVDLALPLRDGPDGSDSFEPRLIFSGGQVFSSRLRSESVGPEKASIGVGFDR